MRHIRSIPRYVLPVGTQGSTHTPTSDLAEQPAYKFTDINTPEEYTTLDEPQTQRLRIGRQNSQQIPKNSNRNSETKHSITFPNTLNIDKTKREVLLLRCADTLSVGVLRAYLGLSLYSFLLSRLTPYIALFPRGRQVV